MRRNKYKKKILSFCKKYRYVIAVNAVFVLLVGALFFVLHESERQRLVVLPSPPAPQKTENYVSSQGPKKIVIEKIGLEAAIEPVGIAGSGNMAVPKSYARAGWYKYGAEPGEVGSAVFAGHLDNGSGSPGVFYNVNKLTIGDEIMVTLESGEAVSFFVRETKVLDYNSHNVEEIFGETNSRQIVLITCDGVWIPELRKYSDRLIVFAEAISSEQQVGENPVESEEEEKPQLI
jgi:LPXTG-site transpeptidase (sortase) family protein